MEPAAVMRWTVVVCVAVLEMAAVHGELPRFHRTTKADGSVSVLIVGDWGRKGMYNQSQLAQQMSITAQKQEIDFVISTGDNFYPRGLNGVDDPAFTESFTNIYTATSLQTTWFSVLGNHDYRGDALAQLSPILRRKDSKWFCLRSYILTTVTAEFFFIDTTPFQDKYFMDPGDEVYDWRGVLPRDKYISTLLQDLQSALQESTAKWKIVVGHHTIKSAGIHGNTLELGEKVLPILEANDVDLYINGHDHCLEHITSSRSPLHFLTSGGGSKAWRGGYNWSNPNDLKFYYDGQGFMTINISSNAKLQISFYDIFGNVLHQWEASKSFVTLPTKIPRGNRRLNLNLNRHKYYSAFGVKVSSQGIDGGGQDFTLRS